MKQLLNPIHLTRQAGQRITIILRMLTLIVSALVLIALFLDYGFQLKPHESDFVRGIYRAARYYYMGLFALRLTINHRQLRRKSLPMTLLAGLLLYMTLLPDLFPLSRHIAILSELWRMLASIHFRMALVGLFAFMELARNVVRLIDKKTNPALLMASAFAVMIFLGTLLLLVPRSTLPDIHLSVIDALFVSTSAVCVTGLTPVDIASTFTFEGQIIIALLIQVGGLGVMTITSFFALFFMGNTGLYNQFALRDMVSSDTFSSLVSTLLYILGFTFAIEMIGAVLIWHSIHGTINMTLHEEFFFSLFHSISAFCNAGFSTLDGNLSNPLVAVGHNGFYLILSFLVILGSIGFPILVNFKRLIGYHLRVMIHHLRKSSSHLPRYTHLTNINTKIVLCVTGALLLIGTLSIALIEWNKAFAAMSVGEKLTQSFFNAVVPRTAGFNSVDLTQFSFLTIFVTMILMWIGGASQSTAGGIKVNTFAVAAANLMAIVRGRRSVVLFGRELSDDSIRRAFAVIFGSLAAIFGCFVILLIIEPDLAPEALFYETLSAYCTVGSSLNLTPALSDAGKLLIAAMMFIGRVGLITILASLLPTRPTPKYRCPKDDVIIN